MIPISLREWNLLGLTFVGLNNMSLPTIWVFMNSNFVQSSVIYSDQQVTIDSSFLGRRYVLSFMYTSNFLAGHRRLWRDLLGL